MKNNPIKQIIKLFLLCSLLVLQSYAQAEIKVTYYVPDASGSPIAATDEQGEVLWRKHYKPFGEEIEQDVASKDNHIGYTGHVHDRSTGLTYMGARYYDPVVGRFMAMDSVGVDAEDPRTFNRYAYGNNNPYKYVDPDGNNPKLIVDFGLNVALNYATTGNANVLGAVRETVQGALNPLKTIQSAKKLTKIWTSTKNKTSVQNALGHFNKHKSEFPAFKNAKQYAEGAKKFLNNPPKGTLTKIRENGDRLLYNPKTNTFGAKTSDGVPKTMFRPKDGAKYWDKQ